MKIAPLRVAGRIAWRNARRNVRRSALIVAAIALPVALATAATTVTRTVVDSPEEKAAATMGAADLTVSVSERFDPEVLESRLPSGSRVAVLHTEDVELVREGQMLSATLVEPDVALNSPVLEGMYGLEAGSGPRTAGEAAVNQRLLDLFDARVGDELEVGDHRLRVTGVATARDLDHPLAVVGEGTLPAASGFTNVLIDLPSPARADAVVKDLDHEGYNTRAEVGEFAARDALALEALAIAAGIPFLFCTALIAAAAFVVGARRQLRELGLVGAAGGEPRHVRAVTWLGGTTLGLVGGVVGGILGLAIAILLHPLSERVVGRVVGPVDVNPMAFVVVIVVAVAAATLAALAPARAAGKSTVMDALAGRTPAPRPPGRVALLGLVFVIAGAAVLAAATVAGRTAMLAAGIVAMLVGVLLAIPLVVSSLGRVTNLLPTTGRLAARDAARHGRKTGAAVAAGVIALATPVAVAAYSLSEETYERRSPRLLANQLMIGGFGEIAREASGAELQAAFAEVFPDASVVPLTQAVSSRGGDIQDRLIFVGVLARGELGGESTGGATRVAWPLFVGDASMLASIGAEEGARALAEGQAVVLGGYEAGKGFVRVSTGGPRGRRAKVAAVTVDSTSYLNESIPRVVVSSGTAARLGLKTQVVNRLLTNPTALSSDEIARARDVAEGFPGVFVRSNDDYLPRYAAARAVATAASLPLGLAILAVAIALVASESRRSHQVLVAIGAGPLSHRKIVAATGALLGGMAALLAVPAGFLPTAVVQAASQTGRPVVFPWSTAAVVVLVVPLLAALGAALVSRTPRLGSLLAPTT